MAHRHSPRPHRTLSVVALSLALSRSLTPSLSLSLQSLAQHTNCFSLSLSLRGAHALSLSTPRVSPLSHLSGDRMGVPPPRRRPHRRPRTRPVEDYAAGSPHSLRRRRRHRRSMRPGHPISAASACSSSAGGCCVGFGFARALLLRQRPAVPSLAERARAPMGEPLREALRMEVVATGEHLPRGEGGRPHI